MLGLIGKVCVQVEYRMLARSGTVQMHAGTFHVAVNDMHMSNCIERKTDLDFPSLHP